jgi:hypothetical protein
MKPRLYLETTIPSYLTAWPNRDLIVAGHQQLTKEWWRTRRDAFEICISHSLSMKPAPAMQRLLGSAWRC